MNGDQPSTDLQQQIEALASPADVEAALRRAGRFLETKAQPFEEPVRNLSTQALELEVEDQESYNLAADLLERIKRLKSGKRPPLEADVVTLSVGAAIDPLVELSQKLLELSRSTRKRLQDPLEEARKALAKRMGDYQTAIEEAAAEERRLREEERKRLEEEVLQEAIELEEEAVEKGAAVHPKAVDAILDRAEQEAPPAPPPAPAAPEGISFREVPKYEVVSAGNLRSGFTKPDTGAIWNHVRGLHRDGRLSSPDQIADAVSSLTRKGEQPAVRIWTEKVPANRR